MGNERPKTKDGASCLHGSVYRITNLFLFLDGVLVNIDQVFSKVLWSSEGGATVTAGVVEGGGSVHRCNVFFQVIKVGDQFGTVGAGSGHFPRGGGTGVSGANRGHAPFTWKRGYMGDGAGSPGSHKRFLMASKK